jgi:hypothetical protein
MIMNIRLATKNWLWILILAIAGPVQGSDATYKTSFQDVKLGTVPDDFLVLDGNFAVKQEGTNRFLELPGAPLETFGFVFGPAAQAGQSVSARVFGTRKGRRYPTFAVSLGGVGGYRLQVTPAKRATELWLGDELKQSIPYAWKSGQWTHLHLQIRAVTPGAWTVEGKVWSAGAAVPTKWQIRLTTQEEPIQGRPGVWGSPFSGTPIGFDDLAVSPVEEN